MDRNELVFDNILHGDSSLGIDLQHCFDEVFELIGDWTFGREINFRTGAYLFIQFDLLVVVGSVPGQFEKGESVQSDAERPDIAHFARVSFRVEEALGRHVPQGAFDAGDFV